MSKVTEITKHHCNLVQKQSPYKTLCSKGVAPTSYVKP